MRHRLSRTCQLCVPMAARFFTYCPPTINAAMAFGSLRRNCSIRFIHKQNGYSETAVFVASFDNEAYWYEVEAPRNGQRIIIQSVGPLYVLCRTKRGGRVSHDRVQQSDYVYAWDRKNIIEPKFSGFKNLARGYLKGSPLAPALRVLNSLFGSVSISRNPSLAKKSVAEVIAKASRAGIAKPQAI